MTKKIKNGEILDLVRTVAAIVAAITLGILAAGIWDRLDHNEENNIKAICAIRSFLDPLSQRPDVQQRNPALIKLTIQLHKSGVRCPLLSNPTK